MNNLRLIQGLMSIVFFAAGSADAQNSAASTVPGVPWLAVDALGRKLPAPEDGGPPRSDRFRIYEHLCQPGPANFPAHEAADMLATRLARFGINCVRLHFMDTWSVNFMPKPTQDGWPRCKERLGRTRR